MNTCPICNSSNVKLYKKRITPTSDLFICNSCKVVFASPFKAPNSDFYTKANDSSSIGRHTKLAPFPKKHPARNYEQLKNGTGKKLLDIGCANGAFASYVSANGFEVLGIDIDEASLELVQKRNLQNTICKYGVLDELVQDSSLHNSFDVVTMFEVFEHLDNPNETILNIKKLLKPEGYFIGSLPNIKRPFMWKYHMNYEVPPYHLTYWVIESWTTFLKLNEFVLLEAQNNNYFGFISDYWRLKINNKLIGKSLEAFKFFIESPIEKITNNGAGFVFLSKRDSIFKK